MILLFGGTSETAPIALTLAAAGHDVLVSTATEIALDTGNHPRVRRRCGKLDLSGMRELIRAEAITAVVDAAHPFAVQLHETAAKAAEQARVPYIRYCRPVAEILREENVFWAKNHDEAARVACAFGGCVLLTIGSRNLEPYARAARAQKVRLVARVLPEADSLAACANAGLPERDVIGARGPFSEADDREAIRRYVARVLVTKESGAAGGLPEKLAAARAESCRVVIVARPELGGATVSSAEEVLARLRK